VKDGQKGKFFSLAFDVKEDQPAADNAPQQGTPDDLDDDLDSEEIPF